VSVSHKTIIYTTNIRRSLNRWTCNDSGEVLTNYCKFKGDHVLDIIIYALGYVYIRIHIICNM
jgi:hypothetical protein